MRINGTIRLLGTALVAAVAVPFVIDPSLRSEPTFIRWAVAYGFFVAAFAAGFGAPPSARRRGLLALAVMVLAVVSMGAIEPCHFGMLSLLVVTTQAALLLSPGRVAGVVVALTATLGFFLACSEAMEDMVSIVLALLGGQTFAAVAVHGARREAEAARELARANAELRATRALLEETSRANERNRLARELHDVLGHDLTALALQLEVASHVPADAVGAPLAKARDLGARLLGNVRAVVSATRDAPPPDLAAALRALVDGTPGIAVHLAIPEALRVDDGARGHCVLRCVQEIVTNALRHAQAQNLWIDVEQTGEGVTVSARDDGRGAHELRAGNGLRGMQARVEELGGWLRVASDPSFAIRAWVPAKGANV